MAYVPAGVFVVEGFVGALAEDPPLHPSSSAEEPIAKANNPVISKPARPAAEALRREIQSKGAPSAVRISSPPEPICARCSAAVLVCRVVMVREIGVLAPAARVTVDGAKLQAAYCGR